MAAPRSVVVEIGGGRERDDDDSLNAESPTGKKIKGRFPLSRFEFAAALGVFLLCSTGLLCIYLTMPAAEYEVLKMPRSLADLRLLK